MDVKHHLKGKKSQNNTWGTDTEYQSWLYFSRGLKKKRVHRIATATIHCHFLIDIQHQKKEKGSSFIEIASPFNRINFRFGKIHNTGFVVFILWRNQGWVTMVQVYISLQDPLAWLTSSSDEEGGCPVLEKSPQGHRELWLWDRWVLGKLLWTSDSSSIKCRWRHVPWELFSLWWADTPLRGPCHRFTMKLIPLSSLPRPSFFFFFYKKTWISFYSLGYLA